MNEFEPLNSNFLDEDFSNFRALGIGKQTAKQKKRKDKRVSRRAEKKEIKKEEKKLYSKSDIRKHSINKFNPVLVTMRGAILGLLNMNMVGIATAFAIIKDAPDKSHWTQIEKKFFDWGGEPKIHLDAAVEKGKKKKPFLKDIIEKFSKHKHKHGFDGYSYADGGMNTAGNVVGGAATLMGTAAGVMALLPDPDPATKSATEVAAGYLGVGSAGFGAMSPILKSFAALNGATPATVDAIPPPPTGQNNPDNIPVVPPTDPTIAAKVAEEETQQTKQNDAPPDDGKIIGLTKPVFFIGVAAVIGGILLLRKIFK